MFFKFDDSDKVYGNFRAAPRYKLQGGNFVTYTSGVIDTGTPAKLYRSSSFAPVPLDGNAVKFKNVFATSGTCVYNPDSALLNFATATLGWEMSSAVRFFSESIGEIAGSNPESRLRSIYRVFDPCYEMADSEQSYTIADSAAPKLFFHHAFHAHSYQDADSAWLASADIEFAAGQTFTYETRYFVNPVTSSVVQYLFSARRKAAEEGFRVFIDTDNELGVAFSGALGTIQFKPGVTASVGQWAHFAFQWDGVLQSGSFMHNLETMHVSSSDNIAVQEVGPVCVGGRATTAVINVNRLHGALHETRIWSDKRTPAEMSGTWNRSLTTDEAADSNLLHYWPATAGSGSTLVDYGAATSPIDLPLHPTFPTDRRSWGISTDRLFTFCESAVSQYSDAMVFDISHVYYGDQIKRESIEIWENSFLSASTAVGVPDESGSLPAYNATKFIDDGNGCLILSGGHTWNKLGRVMYDRGIIMLTNPLTLNNGLGPLSTSSIHFRADHRVFENMYLCRLPANTLNSTTNASYARIVDAESLSGSSIADHPCPPSPLTGSSYNFRATKDEVYVTTIGIYNEHYELVATAKLAQPARVTPNRPLLFKLRHDI